MSLSPSFEYFERVWKEEKVPTLNVDILQSNVSHKIEKRLFPLLQLRRFAIISTVCILISSAVFGFLSNHIYSDWSIFNEASKQFIAELSFKENDKHKLELLEKQVTENYSKNDIKIDHILNYNYLNRLSREVKPGEAVWYVNVEAYEVDHTHYLAMKPLTANDINELKKSTSTSFIPLNLNGFNFSYATIDFQPDTNGKTYDEFLQALYEEAISENKISITKSAKASKKAKQIKMVYYNKEYVQLKITITDNDLSMVNNKDLVVYRTNDKILSVGSKKIYFNTKNKDYTFFDENNGSSYVYTVHVDTSKSKNKYDYHQEILDIIKNM